MAAYTITISDTGESYRCADYRSLLEGMEALGRKGIPVGCRGGGCGVCKVHIDSGSYSKRVMSREHISAEEEAAGTVLACRVKPTSDIRLSVVGKMKKSVCRTVESADAWANHST
jgi:ferredoxin